MMNVSLQSQIIGRDWYNKNATCLCIQKKKIADMHTLDRVSLPALVEAQARL